MQLNSLFMVHSFDKVVYLTPESWHRTVPSPKNSLVFFLCSWFLPLVPNFSNHKTVCCVSSFACSECHIKPFGSVFLGLTRYIWGSFMLLCKSVNTFHCWVVFHCVPSVQLVYPFTSWRTSVISSFWQLWMKLL